MKPKSKNSVFLEHKRRALQDIEVKDAYEEASEAYEMAKCLAKIRKSADLSQRQLAKVSGIKQPQIARIESGKQLPKLDTLIKFAKNSGYSCKVVFTPEKGEEITYTFK